MSIEMEKQNHLRNMDLAALVALCLREIDSAVRGEVQNDQHWQELLRRSTMQRNGAAREVLLYHLGLVVRTWIGCHPKKEIALQVESEAYYMAQTCEQFWQAVVQQEPALDRLSTALLYVRASLNGVMLDALRARTQSSAKLLPGSVKVGEPTGKTSKGSQAEWESICKLLPTEREQRVAYLLFHCGLRPREIVRLRPQEFNSRQEISRVRRTVIELLAVGGDELDQVAQQVELDKGN
jgi:integrase